MAENQADPESVAVGPINPTSTIDPRMKKDKHKFLWSRVHLSHDSIVPRPRSGAASVVVQGKLYVFGGYGVCETMLFWLKCVTTPWLTSLSLFCRGGLGDWTIFMRMTFARTVGKRSKLWVTPNQGVEKTTELSFRIPVNPFTCLVVRLESYNCHCCDSLELIDWFRRIWRHGVAEWFVEIWYWKSPVGLYSGLLRQYFRSWRRCGRGTGGREQ